MSLINFNGKLLNEATPVFPVSTRLRFGDGFFESMRMFNGSIAFWHEHFQRIMQSATLLQFQMPSHFTNEFLKNEILKLTEALGIKHARVRVQFFRSGSGRYKPETNDVMFAVEADSDGMESYQLHNVEWLGVSKLYHKAYNSFSCIKSGSALLYVLASLEADDCGFDEMILPDEQGNVCEALASNIFCVTNDERFITPPLSSGCVAGVMRKKIIELTGAEEKNLTIDELKSARAIFLTNAGKGIQHVKQFEEVEFLKCAELNALVQRLNSLASATTW